VYEHSQSDWRLVPLTKTEIRYPLGFLGAQLRDFVQFTIIILAVLPPSSHPSFLTNLHTPAAQGHGGSVLETPVRMQHVWKAWEK
jgi:hypothetical protein